MEVVLANFPFLTDAVPGVVTGKLTIWTRFTHGVMSVVTYRSSAGSWRTFPMWHTGQTQLAGAVEPVLTHARDSLLLILMGTPLEIFIGVAVFLVFTFGGSRVLLLILVLSTFFALRLLT